MFLMAYSKSLCYRASKNSAIIYTGPEGQQSIHLQEKNLTALGENMPVECEQPQNREWVLAGNFYKDMHGKSVKSSSNNLC